MGRKPPRVVVLTVGGRYGVQVLRSLQARGVVPSAVLIEAHTALRDCFHARTPGGRFRELPLVPLRAAARHLRPRLRRDLRIGAPLVVTGPLNSATMQRDLQRLRPDLLVLAGTGIVSPELLAIPRVATVNAHLALLPWVRGNDVVAHSILRRCPLGVTCHLVDQGVDTGPIIRRRLLNVSASAASLDALEMAIRTAGAELLAEVTAEVVRDHRVPSTASQDQRFPLHRFLPADRRDEADTLIRAGIARELFERWVAFADPDSLDLPVEIPSDQQPTF